MKKNIANGLLLLAAVAVMAGVFEGLCRTALNDGTQYHVEMWRYAVELKRVAEDPEIGHEHIPGAHARLMGVDVSINSDGLRDKELEEAKPTGVTRILMLGDSITFGWGVPADETLPRVLERELTAQGAGPIEVINSGVGNYNTAMEAGYFFDHGKAYDPDIVVLNYFINDAEPTPIYKEVPWLARHSYAYAVIGGAWDSLKRRLFGGADWRTYYAGLYADGAPGWRKAQESIAKLAAYCRANDIRFIIVNIPELRELKEYPFHDVTAKVKAAAETHHVEFVDLLPAVEDLSPDTLWVTKPDPHPNGRAQELMGIYFSNHLLRSSSHLELAE